MEQRVTKRAVAEIPIFEYSEVTSTQDIARELIESGIVTQGSDVAGEMLAVVSADFQNVGRGRLARIWKASKNSSVLSTFILARRDHNPMVDIAHLMIAVCQCLREHSVEVCIKWPNDLVDAMHGKKLGGCLSEIEGDFILVGIGINVSHGAYPKEFEDTAISLVEMGYEIEPSRLLDHIILKYSEHRDPPAEDIWSAYRELSATLGTDVRIQTLDGVVVAHAVDIDEAGSLIIDSYDGQRQTISVGDIVHLRSNVT